MERQYIVALLVVVIVGGLLLSQAKGSYHTVDSNTFLELQGHLVNKDTGQAVTNAVVILIGSGLPAQGSTDSNGNLRVMSSSPAEQIQVQMIVAGYKPYGLIVPRQMVISECFQCQKMGVFLLTPLPRSLHRGGNSRTGMDHPLAVLPPRP